MILIPNDLDPVIKEILETLIDEIESLKEQLNAKT